MVILALLFLRAWQRQTMASFTPDGQNPPPPSHLMVNLPSFNHLIRPSTKRHTEQTTQVFM